MARITLLTKDANGLICDGIFDTVAEVQSIAQKATYPIYISFDRFGLVKMWVEKF